MAQAQMCSQPALYAHVSHRSFGVDQLAKKPLTATRLIEARRRNAARLNLTANRVARARQANATRRGHDGADKGLGDEGSADEGSQTCGAVIVPI